MNTLYFTSPYRRSTRTIRLEYGEVKNKFVLRTFEGKIIGRKVSEEGSPKEEVFEDEQELLKKVHKTKKGLLEGKWIVKNKQSFSQPSFLKTEIVEDFVEQIDKEIETNIQKGVRK